VDILWLYIRNYFGTINGALVASIKVYSFNRELEAKEAPTVGGLDHYILNSSRLSCLAKPGLGAPLSSYLEGALYKLIYR